MTEPKVKFEQDGKGDKSNRQKEHQGGDRRKQTQKANQRYSRAAYSSPIDEIKDQIFSVGSTSFK